MIRWIYENINHLVVPFGMFLGLTTAVLVTLDQRRKKAGMEGVGRGYRFAVIIMLLIACLFGGMVLIHSFA